MRVVASAASIAALLLSLSGPAAACYGGNCYGGFYQIGGVVQAAPPVVQTAPVYQAPVVQAPPVYQAPVVQTAPVYQAPVVQTPPVVVQTPPSVVINNVPPANYAEPYRYRSASYDDYGYRYRSASYDDYGYGARSYGRTVYYERGPEYLVSYNVYPTHGYGSKSYYDGGYYSQSSYYDEPRYYDQPYYAPYYRPYYHRPVICTGGAYETGQAICGQRP